MAFHVTLAEVLTLLCGLMALGLLACIAIRRWLKAYTIRITADYSNPGGIPRVYYALYNKRNDTYVLIKHLLSVWPYKSMRYVNFAAYQYGRKCVDAIESYTGKPGDIDIIPVHHATPSRLGVENWLQTVRGSLVELLLKGEEVDKLDADGKLIMVPKKDKHGKIITSKEDGKPVIVVDTEKVGGLNLTDDDKQKLDKLITVKWFGTANGFLPVEDIGVLKEDIRQAAKRFYARSYEKEQEGLPWYIRYGAVLAFSIMIVGVCIGMGLYWNFFFTGLKNYCAAGYCPNYKAPAATNQTGSILSSPTGAIANALTPK
jgi:nitrate reductase NapAB chaperone NapD